MKGTKSYQRQARKNQRSEKDIPIKFKVIKILREQFGLIGLTGETISIPGKLYHRMPDIYIPEKRTVIELDGGIHGLGDPISKLESDRRRDEDYIKANLKEIIINSAQTENYTEEKIINTLKESGLVSNAC